MAQMQAIYSWAILLAVITCHGILSGEGRQLKPMKKEVGVQTVPITKDNITPSTKSMESSTVAEPIADFRPTTPGNSPGVGHSYTEHSVVVQPNEASKISKLLKESKQESTTKQKVPTVSNSIDGFRPTAPGNSPGVGHAFTGNDVKVQTKGVGIGPAIGHSNAGSTDDFKPTQPGHSPGVGHSFRNKNTEPNA
ncbi:hypothetical protein DCAR_0729555 [Daucus carota subsp. sativus]|uniref:Uncharacterized protein n=1 Tax=Daucus carota subsp. sativus TaxID=79200 RepID=A0A164UB09_DAUCS|nr:PREDICTED: uncharacterized protein LOC108193707 [Daucus carota subsp. sativus]WOH10094.1 hypothetical protein DCAR_0729555 [Daucus carota subsp. sativus]